jgi:hypothetical protein
MRPGGMVLRDSLGLRSDQAYPCIAQLKWHTIFREYKVKVLAWARMFGFEAGLDSCVTIG